MTIINRIKEQAKKNNLNLKSTALKAGLSENAIYKWNSQKPNSAALKSVADVLGVSTDYLLGNTDEIYPDTNPNSRTIDLREVADEERYDLISAGGRPITDEDWAVIKAVLAKYPKKKG